MRKQHIALALVGALALGIVGCGQQQQAAQQSASQSDLISPEQATQIATSYIAGDNNVSDVSCDLPDGSSSPRYVVKYHYDDADYLVKVDARDGSVWYATAIYNDGTTRDVTKAEGAEQAETQQEQANVAEE